MRPHEKLWILVAALVVAASPALAARYQKVRGEVVAVEQQVQTANGGMVDRLTIRTRQGEQMRLHLGPNGACEGCFQVGDHIRARLMVHDGTGAGSGYQVHSMTLRRDGEMFGFHRQGDRLVPGGAGWRGQGAAGFGTGDHDRDRMRMHEPGTGGHMGSGRRGGGGQG